MAPDFADWNLTQPDIKYLKGSPTYKRCDEQDSQAELKSFQMASHILAKVGSPYAWLGARLRLWVEIAAVRFCGSA